MSGAMVEAENIQEVFKSDLDVNKSRIIITHFEDPDQVTANTPIPPFQCFGETEIPTTNVSQIEKTLANLGMTNEQVASGELNLAGDFTDPDGNPLHCFRRAGTYSVTLSFQDKAGNAVEKSFSIEVISGNYDSTKGGGLAKVSNECQQNFATGSPEQGCLFQLTVKDPFDNPLIGREINIVIEGQDVSSDDFIIDQKDDIAFFNGLGIAPKKDFDNSLTADDQGNYEVNVGTSGDASFVLTSLLPSGQVSESEDGEGLIFIPTQQDITMDFKVPEVDEDGDETTTNSTFSVRLNDVVFDPWVLNYFPNGVDLEGGEENTIAVGTKEFLDTLPSELKYEFTSFDNSELVESLTDPDLDSNGEGDLILKLKSGIGDVALALSSMVSFEVDDKEISYPGIAWGDILDFFDEFEEDLEEFSDDIADDNNGQSDSDGDSSDDSSSEDDEEGMTCSDFVAGLSCDNTDDSDGTSGDGFSSGGGDGGDGGTLGGVASYTQATSDTVDTSNRVGFNVANDTQVKTGDSVYVSAGGTLSEQQNETEFRLQMTQNAFELTRGISSGCGANTTVDISTLSDEEVLYFESCDVKLTGGELAANTRATIVISNGNLTISGDLSYGNSQSSLGIIMVDMEQNGEGYPTTGNVSIESDVQKVVGTLYAEGSLLSCESPASSCDGGNNQLFWEGLLVTRNTLGGASGVGDGSGTDIYPTPWAEDNEDQILAQQYDLDWVRRYTASDSSHACVYDGNGTCIEYNNSFVLLPDGRAVNVPPPGFSTSQGIRR